ncbi:hypothetical protein B0G71_4358 [Paraburkholderia sp. BL27I4N3]|uniref:hypothetical protein n=1 Tax=Paraburkholderia sp. BL27I4N3 TaxID=1938805 RepID=UPI000E22846F|nr:hypothetical protein [Paraburkholderia sp. BL27I4N3]REE21206.1 hypothetical protein B0G71_4358 [Paraburkholderia sp. BL27I4N3]
MDAWQANRMSRQQQEAFEAAHRRGENPDPRHYSGADARADAAKRGDAHGLIKRTSLDAANRPHYTYEPATRGQRKFWLDEFRSQGFVQIKINNSSEAQTPEMKASALSLFRMSHPDLKV